MPELLSVYHLLSSLPTATCCGASSTCPPARAPRAVLLFVHGYGRTDVVAQNWYYDLRSALHRAGDRQPWSGTSPASGKQRGRVRHQPARGEQRAARCSDAIAAAAARRPCRGAAKIGLWGISRAGWIAPHGDGSQDPRHPVLDLGQRRRTTRRTSPTCIESNLRIEGRSEAQIRRLMSEWRRGFELTGPGRRPSQAYLDATKDPETGPVHDPSHRQPDPEQGGVPGGSAALPAAANSRSMTETGLMIYVPGFRDLLAPAWTCPCSPFSARRTGTWTGARHRALYTETIGRNPKCAR